MFVFLEAKMQGYNRAPLFDRLNRYSQVAFLFSSSMQGLNNCWLSDLYV
ncbi:hypothetical protein [Escherichia coli ISC41]|nr:hypothetical protein [Escherichia coli ISC41]CDL50981.1 hypothetical protein [Escherichia coli ISC41]